MARDPIRRVMDEAACRAGLDSASATLQAAVVACTHVTRLATPRGFDLALALLGHGWIQLPPHRWDEAAGTWHTALRAGERPVDVAVVQRTACLQVRVTCRTRLSRPELAAVRDQLRHMLRMDEDLGPFHDACRGVPRLAWVTRRRAGVLLRSPTVFEDLVKLLFTTNCTWTQTVAMTRKLVDAAGDATPSGARCFPTVAQCRRGAAFFRDTVRAGYRAEALADLAEAFANDALTECRFLDRGLDAGTLWQRLLALRGFGPYAAGQAMRLLGHYEHLAIDSWCRARLAALQGRSRAPADRTIARRYRGFGKWAGLAMWCEITAGWHGEG